MITCSPILRVACCAAISFLLIPRTAAAEPAKALLVGAAVVDVSPISFPVAVNGNMTANYANGVTSPVNARAIVMSQGDRRVAMVVVDSCMLPRDLLDQTKAMAAERTGIAKDRIMISATHTHTAPAAMSCLGTDADPEYQAYLRIKVTESIEAAAANLEPARVGWGSIDADHYTAIRRWIRRPDRLADDPFGNPTVRANMHSGRNWDEVTGPSGPEDPELSLIAFETLDGRPIAVMANFSMHYFSGVKAINPDYFGLFSDGIQTRLTAEEQAGTAERLSGKPVVGIMSHGCSGDIWRRDYTRETPPEFETISIDDYSAGLIELAMTAYREIEFVEAPELAMAESRFRLNYRVPDAQLLQWSQQIVERMGDRLPQTSEEIYAREQIYLHEAQDTEVVVQAIRIGDIGIATTPNETYALTGLKLKRQSPLRHTMVIELANGGDGYIPPPEQHVLGGYNTWPARSAGLEVNAEPKITAVALSLLETVAGKTRKPHVQPLGAAAEQLMERRPLAYWRMDDLAGPRARDVSGNQRDAIYEPGVVFFLEGPRSDQFTGSEELNRAAHFAGGRMRARLGPVATNYEVSLWIWNGMPSDGRDVTGWFYSRGTDFSRPAAAEQLGIGGMSGHADKLILQLGDQQPVGGRTSLKRWRWNHVRLVRSPEQISVFLDGDSEPEITVAVDGDVPEWAGEWFFGGSSDGRFNWEGRLDEIAVYATTAD